MHKEEQLPLLTEKSEYASMKSSVFAGVCSTIGGGMLSLPFAFQGTGIVFGVIILGIAQAMTIFSCQLLIDSGRLIGGGDSYVDVVQEAFGIGAGRFLMFLQAFYTLCIAIAYLVLEGDLLPGVMRHFGVEGGLFAERWFLMLFPAVIAGFSASVPNLNMLRYTSIVNLVCMHLLVLSVVASFFLGEFPSIDSISWFAFKPDVFLSISILSVGYFIHYSILPIQSELFNPIKRRMDKVMFRTETLITCLYTVMGIFGYVSFPGEIKGNIMLNYSNGNTLMTVSKLLISFILMTGLPLMILPLRQVIEKTVLKVNNYSLMRSLVICLSLCTVSYLVASQIPNIISVWSFVGAVCCNFTAFVVPPAVYRKLTDDKESREYKKASILMYVGILLMLLCTGVSTWNALKT